jgi:cytochrome c oxidase assembly factor CtaG
MVDPPPLTWERLATAWTLNPGVLVVVASLGLAYAWGMRRLHRAGAAWPTGRSWWFLLGLASILLVTVTFVAVYANTLFWDRAVRNIVLLMIMPMFLALAAPLTLLRDVLPEPATRAAGRVLHSAAARALTFPAVVTIALIAPLFVLYLTPLYEARRRGHRRPTRHPRRTGCLDGVCGNQPIGNPAPAVVGRPPRTGPTLPPPTVSLVRG